MVWYPSFAAFSLLPVNKQINGTTLFILTVAPCVVLQRTVHKKLLKTRSSGGPAWRWMLLVWGGRAKYLLGYQAYLIPGSQVWPELLVPLIQTRVRALSSCFLWCQVELIGSVTKWNRYRRGLVVGVRVTSLTVKFLSSHAGSSSGTLQFQNLMYFDGQWERCGKLEAGGWFVVIFVAVTDFSFLLCWKSALLLSAVGQVGAYFLQSVLYGWATLTTSEVL